MHDVEKQLYPNVLGSTVSGPVDTEGGGRENRFYTQAVTNNQDTVIRTSVYWYIPSDGGEPALIIEIDDEEDPNGPDNMDVRIRVRRNDGLVYEGTQADQDSHKCKICHEPIHQVKEWKHIHSGEMYCHTGDGSMALPEEAA